MPATCSRKVSLHGALQPLPFANPEILIRLRRIPGSLELSRSVGKCDGRKPKSRRSKSKRLDHVLTNPARRGIKAILLYPMNVPDPRLRRTGKGAEIAARGSFAAPMTDERCSGSIE
jgi:hypothetical protein